MIAGVSIQKLEPADWERYQAIRLSALADSPDAFGSLYVEERVLLPETWRARLSRDDAITLVGSDDAGNDIGLITAAPYDEHAGLYSMWVAPTARQRSLGQALIRQVIKWAHRSGHRKILLDVGVENHAAIALYRSCRFTPTGITGRLPAPRDHIAEQQMQRELTAVEGQRK
ncbi:MAG: GNAT family N-acetyltransferase [Synoicihabitans sp.]